MAAKKSSGVGKLVKSIRNSALKSQTNNAQYKRTTRAKKTKSLF